MKRAAYILGIGTLLFAAMSCSNKFLDENEVDLYTLRDTLFLSTYEVKVHASFQTYLDDDYEFTIFRQPRWLSFESNHGKIEDGHFSLDLTIIPENVYDWQPVVYGTIYLDVEELGMMALTVSYACYWYAELQLSPSTIDFTSSVSSEFMITNTGLGILVWDISSKPFWLTVSLSEGTLYPSESHIVQVGIKPELLTPGVNYTGTIIIGSNAGLRYSILQVTAGIPAIPSSEPGQVTSILVDAEYHHDSGIMAVCTKSPDQLLLFNMVSGESDTIPLDKTPGCISFTEDGHKAVIGYSVASVAYIDIDSRKITAEYDIGCIPYDIASGENGWCYITPAYDQWVMLRNLNLSTGEVITSATATSIYEKALIRKVPGKPYMAGSQLGLLPSSLLMFDLTDGQAKDPVSRYHESIGHFWLSKDGARIYSGYRNVYTIPEYDGQFHSDSPPLYGIIGSELAYINALDECPAISSVFVSSTNYFSTGGTTSLIEQFNTMSLNKIKNFTVSPVWLHVAGTDNLYETTPRFIFVNKEGTAMYVLKNLRPGYDSDCWFMETIEL